MALFRLVADIFAISQEEFDDSLAFITGKPSSSLLTISGEEETDGNHIRRKGMEGMIRVFFIRRFDKQIFTYHGSGQVFMNDIPLSPDMFYAWQHSSVLKGPLFFRLFIIATCLLFSTRMSRKKSFVWRDGILILLLRTAVTDYIISLLIWNPGSWLPLWEEAESVSLRCWAL